MKELLAAGAKSNYQALVGAARQGSPQMIEMLAASGADVNEVSRWGTALILAAHSKRVDTTEALLRVGADPHLRLPADHRNYPGQSALDVAKKEKASKVVAILEAALSGRGLTAGPPELTDDVPALWKRIDTALKANRAVKPSLQKPATEAQIAKSEAAIGITFPPALRASYRIHNGQKSEADCLFPEELFGLDGPFSLLSLDEIVNEWQTWKRLLDAGEFKKRKGNPDAGIRSDWWNPNWISFANDGGGDSLCIDLAPARGGAVGQVILHRHDDPSRSKIAGNFRELLPLLADNLEETAGAGV
jgi:cell wall assembly regulator SMI1